MAAALTLWRRKDVDPRPAKAANQSPLDAGHRPLAADTDAREQQVKRRGDVFVHAISPLPGDQTSEVRIASRLGSNPNQRWKESAPCSMSIGNPSAARFP